MMMRTRRVNHMAQNTQAFVNVSSFDNIHNSQQAKPQAMTASDVYKSLLQDYPDVLNVDQVGDILGISTKTVYRLLNEGSLASLKAGRAFKIPKLYVMKYIKVLDRVET
jgi:excisionase family DNA binding protein